MKRTNIVLDERLLEEGKRATGLKTGKAVIDYALKELVRRHNQKRILLFRGKVEWSGSIKKMRSMRGSA